ncbi:MAG TPA: ABC transporter ATP-binding protein [Dehalococcoidia bacterium]|nr:ABC transporter ATP-binding protein [Dehalococcoidia bacterium]
MGAEPILQVTNLRKYFPAGGNAFLSRRPAGWVKAVDDITFTIHAGETLGLVGESGCGKTTTSKLILRLEEPTSGQMLFLGQDVAKLNGRNLMAYRKSVQAVFQDPYMSLSPRMRVRDIIAEPLEIHTNMSKKQIDTRVGEVLELVGMRPAHMRLYPHEFSGGQRQRLAIARALSTEAKLIVLDEAVSALDVSIRAQIINLLVELQERLGVGFLFIGHDLAVVSHTSHRIAVMYLGKIVEIGPSEKIALDPQHPYTKALFAAALPHHPDDVKDAPVVVKGEVPSALNPPSGCRFHPRCPYVMPHCSTDIPPLLPTLPNHEVACHLYTDVKSRQLDQVGSPR